MIRMKSGYAEVGDGKLSYEMGGEGETVVFVHAGFVDSGMWDDQWEAFASHFRVIRFDMRGYGKSDLVKVPISRRQDLHGLLKQLNVRRAHLIGCSMGGEIVMDFALEHPAMVSSLTVISAIPSGFQMQGAPPPTLLEMMAAVQQGDLTRASELQLRLWVDGMYRQPAQVDQRVRQRAAAMNRIVLANGTWGKADAQPLNPLDPPAASRLDQLHLPVLIVAGALDHPEILRAADLMASSIAGSKKVILPDCAHVPNMEKPAAFNQAVLDFLDDHR